MSKTPAQQMTGEQATAFNDWLASLGHDPDNVMKVTVANGLIEVETFTFHKFPNQ